MSHKQNDIIAEHINEEREQIGLAPVTLSEALELWLENNFKVETTDEIIANYVL